VRQKLRLKSLACILLASALVACGLSSAAAQAPDITDHLPAFVQLADVVKFGRAMNCADEYPLPADAYHASAMRGFYCVSGRRENFRLVKIFESAQTAKQDTDLYSPIQTGGRKLYLKGNWFLFGLATDAAALAKVSVSRVANSTIFDVKFSSASDACMGMLTSSLDLKFSKTDDPSKLIASGEKFFSGFKAHFETAVQKNASALSRAYAAANGLLQEQRLAEASLGYRNFCRKQKFQSQ
jgi:uncharacterized protein YaiE (UPF0345 family)